MERSSQIIQIVEKNPGIKFSEIMRESGMKNGVLSYYTRKLEKSGTVKVERSPRQTRFYPLNLTDEELILIRNLRQETPKQILLSLLYEDMLTFNRIGEKVNKSPSTVSIYLTQLLRDGIIENKFLGPKKVFHIKDIERVQNIIHKYHPNLLDRTADHLADTFSLF